MKLLIPALIGACLVTAASGAMTIVQTENFAFKPNGNAVLNFDQFDTMSGTRSLVSVQVEVFYTKIGGSLEVDNDSETAGTIDVSHSVLANLTSGVSLVKDDLSGSVGTAGSMDAISEQLDVSIGATSGDPTNQFNSQPGEVDFYRFEPGNTTASDSGYITAAAWGGYQGTGTYNITYNASQTTSATGLGGLQQAFVTSDVEGYVRITYTYIPEPSTAALAGLGALALLRRRRR